MKARSTMKALSMTHKNETRTLGKTVQGVLTILTLLALCTGLQARAETEASGSDDAPVALSVEELKKRVIELNRDLFILEEDLLFPANTQFVVFLSLDTGQFLQLDSVKLKVDTEIVAAHLYTERQLKALQRGGMQRLFLSNLKTGEHEVTVFVEGIGPDQRAYKKAASRVIEKGTDRKALEIRIRDRSEDYQPDVDIVEWESE